MLHVTVASSAATSRKDTAVFMLEDSKAGVTCERL